MHYKYEMFPTSESRFAHSPFVHSAQCRLHVSVTWKCGEKACPFQFLFWKSNLNFRDTDTQDSDLDKSLRIIFKKRVKTKVRTNYWNLLLQTLKFTIPSKPEKNSWHNQLMSGIWTRPWQNFVCGCEFLVAKELVTCINYESKWIPRDCIPWFNY